MAFVKRLLLGKPLEDSAGEAQRLSRLGGLALLSSDALSSVAYGTEQIILVLALASAAAFWWSLPIAGLVIVLLAALTASYRQIIHAYPQGGGAYVVTTENLGRTAGLVAAASLLVDYMLTVAVSVSAGAEAITSALPGLYGHEPLIACALIVVLTLVNLRGARESARLLVAPVYLFAGMMVLMIAVGLVRIAIGQVPFNGTSAIGTVVPGVTLALLLRAFSSGSASLTGVEAISNAVPLFREPKAKNAAGTLTLMAILLGLFFAGVTFLNWWYGIVPQHEVTTLAQVASATFGADGVLFYLFQLATALILAVAANTGFSAFPLLSYNLARDKYMPHAFLARGDRLGYSNGIMFLATGAVVLILLFDWIDRLLASSRAADTGGITSLLIPLYAVGVFIPFALAQTGMVVRWARTRPARWALRAIPNAIGAIIAYAVVGIMFTFRLHDIWPFFIVIPALLGLFAAIHSHYRTIAGELRLEAQRPAHAYSGSTVIVLIANLTRVDAEAIDYARAIGQHVVAIHVATDEDPDREAAIRQRFEERFGDIKLAVVRSPYRSIVQPIVQQVDLIRLEAQARNHAITVLVGRFVPRHRWQRALHNQTALKLRLQLAERGDVVVANYTYRLSR